MVVILRLYARCTFAFCSWSGNLRVVTLSRCRKEWIPNMFKWSLPTKLQYCRKKNLFEKLIWHSSAFSHFCENVCSTLNSKLEASWKFDLNWRSVHSIISNHYGTVSEAVRMNWESYFHWSMINQYCTEKVTTVLAVGRNVTFRRILFWHPTCDYDLRHTFIIYRYRYTYIS